MIDFAKLQKDVVANKKAKGFNTTNVDMEFNLLHGELAEAYDAWHRKKGDLGEELADVAIYLAGIAEILGVDLEEEIRAKVEKNKSRVYVKKDGVFVKQQPSQDS